MFTTGSKFFFGTAFVAAVVALVQGVNVVDPAAVIVLSGVAVVAAFLGAVIVATRDAHAKVPVAGAAGVPGAPQVGASIWPIVGGLGTALLALGIVTDRRLAGLGVIAVLATVVEWMIQAWSERSTAEDATNAGLRGRVAHPLEFPILGVLMGGAVVFAMSRIMVSLAESQATIVFAVVGIVVLFAAIAIWKMENLSSRKVGVIVTVGAVLLGAGAIVGVNRGEHVLAHEPESELDGNKRVALKSNTIASVRFHDEKIELRHDSEVVEHLEVPRSTLSSLLVTNDSAERVRFIVESSKVETDAEGNSKVVHDEFVTDPLSPGSSKVLVVNFPKSGKYRLLVAPIAEGHGEEADAAEVHASAEVEVVVP